MSTVVPGIGSTRKLAEALAEIAQEIGVLRGDLAAQVAVYRLFLARLNSTAHSAPVPDDIWLSEASRLLDCVDLQSIFASHTRQGKDPAIYFYQEFLNACDPAGSRRRGVHYSPPAVVSYIVRGVESVLRDRFGIQLSDATVADPCLGIGTFLRHIETRCPHHGRLVGIELMPATCELAELLLHESDVIQADWLSPLPVLDEPLENQARPLVIIGNPPYSGHSANGGKIADLMADYRAGLNERNPKWLQDDYVKFIRMAQERVERAGRGIVAFITNHSFVFNPTFRAMRASLMRTFDEIRILDLHGNAKRVESNTLGEVDENVFPIRMGVAITFMIKTGSTAGQSHVYYADLRGSRDDKLRALDALDFDSTPWREITLTPPFVLFVPGSASVQDDYARFASVVDLFRESSVGFVTSRDRFAVDRDREALTDRLEDLADPNVPVAKIRELYPVGDLDIEAAREQMQRDPDWRERIVEVQYRPFDRRWAFLSRAVMERPRLPFMDKLLDGRIALAVGRAGHATGSPEWDVVFCTDCPTDLNLFRRGGALLLLGPDGPVEDEALFYYMYGLLHSSEYRRRYANLLMIDFPRIAIPRDKRVIQGLAEAGEELVRVHVMRGTPEPHPSPLLQGEGAHGPHPNPLLRGEGVQGPHPNPLLRGEGVQGPHPSPLLAGEGAPSVRIGGYDLPHKYLADRKGRQLGPSEVAHYACIQAAVARTLDIRATVDSLVDRNPPWA